MRAKSTFAAKWDALGSDAVQADLTEDDIVLLSDALADAGMDMACRRLPEDRIGQETVQL